MKTFTRSMKGIKSLVPIIGFLMLTISGIPQPSKVDVIITGGLEEVNLLMKMEANLEKLLNLANTSYRSKAQALNLSGNWFTASLNDNLIDFWEHSHFYCYSSRIRENVILVGYSGEYNIRNIPIVLQFGDTIQAKVSFLKDGTIDGFGPSIAEHQYKEAMQHSGTIDKTRKEIILDFMENMKTAYMKKDIDFVESIFSDKALIIVGKKIKVQEGLTNDRFQINLPPDRVEYIELTKSQYLERLRRVFEKNSYINVGYDRFELARHRKLDDFYGVTLRQRWNTPTYTDVGIMFFMIQFQEDSMPKIWVRTWQDEKSVSNGETVFGFGDFVIR